jgi:hypothetical protein
MKGRQIYIYQFNKEEAENIIYFLTRCIILFSYVKAFAWNYDIIICFFIRSETKVWYLKFNNVDNYSLKMVHSGRSQIVFHEKWYPAWQVNIFNKNGTQLDKLNVPWK